VGNNGETLVADSSTSTGLRYQGNFAAGKNKIINGDFGIWQRGTSFTPPAGANVYTADRLQVYFTFSSGTPTVSRQAFTAGTAPVAGYEGTYFLRASKPASNGYCILGQPIEDVRTFAGQTITVSWWAKVNSGTVASTMYVRQKFGSGGSADVNYNYNYTATTSWQRFTQTITLNSVSGKTIGAGSSLNFEPVFNLDSNAYDIDIWGLQVEAGSVATAFQTATGTLQGELSAAQRYYFRQTSNSTNGAAVPIATGIAGSTTSLSAIMNYPVTMRSVPTSVDFALVNSWQGGALTAISNVTLASNSVGTDKAILTCTTTGLTSGQSYGVLTNASGVAGFIGLSAEL
jgi:hypothetical protein